MPGFVTHHIFGVNSYRLSENKDIKSIIKKHSKAYALGLQGPDLFFYFLPTSTGMKPDVASKMHKEKTGRFFYNLIDSCRTICNDDEFEAGSAYILGYVGHYILDTSMHPYVYHRVGTRASKEILGIHFGLETDIDRKVLMHYKGLKMSEFDHKKAVDVTSSEQNAIAKILHKAILATYDIDIPISMIKSAIISFKIESSLIMDKKEYKHKVISFIEEHTIKHPLLSPLLINEVEHMEDPCNEEHKEWCNPWETSQTSCESVFELMDRKAEDYAQMMVFMNDALIKAYNHEPDENPRILKELGNLSFTSGLDCEIKINRD